MKLKYVETDSKPCSALQDSRYSLIQTDYDLESLKQYLGKGFKAITGALVIVGDGDYDEIWITEDSPYYDLDSWYTRIELQKIPTYTYVVTLNQPGYLPEAEPMEFDSLRDAKNGLREQVESFLDMYWNNETPPAFTVYTPLRSITKRELLKSGEFTYGEFSDGYRLNIAIVKG